MKTEDASPGRPRKGAKTTIKETTDSELQRLEPKPYFVTIALGGEETDFKNLNGILSYEVSTRESSWRRRRFAIKSFYEEESCCHPAFHVEGLIYCHHPDDLDQQAVFSIHTKKWHLVPPPPEISKSSWVLGMTVDTAEKPYSFKLFQGSLDKKTQVYDSKSGSWSTRSSLLGSLTQVSLEGSPLFTSCTSCNGHLYLSRGPKMILVYSIEGDSWSILGGPPTVQDEDEDDEDEGGEHTLGAFEGRIFTTTEVLIGEDSHIVVWELVDQAKSEWVEYARITGEPYEWLQELIFFGHGTSENLAVVTCYCDQYLFLYHWSFMYARADGYVLFDLATKECIKVDLPKGTIRTERIEWEDEYGDLDDDEDSENEEEEEEAGEDDEEEGEEDKDSEKEEEEDEGGDDDEEQGEE